MSQEPRYKIVRFFQGPDIPSKVIHRGLTLEEAQEHCGRAETSSRTATTSAAKAVTKQHGPWFDGYTLESS